MYAGVARGCGWQDVAAWTNLVAFYMIGVPLALLFGFKLGLHEQVSNLFLLHKLYMHVRQDNIVHWKIYMIC